VLIVEDDATLARLLVHALERRGHTVEVADTAEAADERLRRGPKPSMVLLDVNLPGESGWSLFRNGLLSAVGSPPTVMTSAIPLSPARLREFHVAGYLPKPFPIEVLMDCVDRLGTPRTGVPGTLDEAEGPSRTKADA
jgi:DNA-binding response OmpR family regulator